MASDDNLTKSVFGAIFWIDDCKVGLGKAVHPWVVIEDYRPSSPYVRVCLRTTSGRGSVEIPAYYNGVQVDDFNKDGRIDPGFRRTVDVEVIRSARYAGLLPPPLREILRNALCGGSQ